MRLLSIVPACVLAAAPVSQVRFDAVTTGTATASAGVFFFGQWFRDQRSLPPATPMLGRSVFADVDWWECRAYGSCGVAALADGVRCNGAATTFGLCPMEAAAALPVRLSVAAPAPTRGRLRIDTSERAWSIQQVWVDVLGDRDAEVTTPGSGLRPAASVEVAVELTPTPLPIDVQLGAATAGDSSATVRFATDGGGEVGLEEQACAPLLGSLTRDGAEATLRLHADGLPPAGAGFAVFGVGRIRVPVPPTGCPLLTDLAVVVPRPIQAGSVALRVPVPPGLVGTLFAQVLAGEVVGGGERWTTTPRLRIDLR